MQDILTDWDAFAETLSPAADEMSLAALRDHAEKMLRWIAENMDSEQTPGEQVRKSHGEETLEGRKGAASDHGHDRYADNFTLVQMVSEFRAVRASVLRLWAQEVQHASKQHLEDVTRFNEAVDQALAESIDSFSKRTENARDMFDAILGHDLRGPLATISLAGERLGQPELPAAKVATIGLGLKRAARFMTAMVDDLLVFARSRLGDGMPINRRTVDILKLCEDAAADARAMHPDCDIELKAAGPPDAQFDENRMHQLLVNLLGNACQHGEQGRPILFSVDGHDKEIVFRVVNEGKQIPAHHLKRIFEPMVQLESESATVVRSNTSLGLGLHIARAIALGHCGTIHATSTAERTEFVVQVPREVAET